MVMNYESSRRLFLAAYGPGAPTRKLPYASKAAFADDVPGTPPDPTRLHVPAGSAPLIVSVSRHDPRKGLDVLLQALAGLRARGVPFRACLTSSGPLLSAHRRLATRLGLDQVTVFTGWVPDPILYLRAAEVFVLPSLQEGSGSLALLEALQAGCAVVASDIDGVPEDVVHGESALLVPPSDAGALQRALETVLVDAGLRSRLARAARATFETRFSADVFAAAIRDVYAELGVHPSRPA
jgi:glycosyltransferase involved in cell wall biosynthesis